MSLFRNFSSKLRSLGENQKTFFCVDHAPTPSQPTLSGWALDQTEAISLQLIVDGKVVHDLICNVPRADVFRQFPDLSQSLLSGFSLDLPWEHFKRIGPGHVSLQLTTATTSHIIWEWKDGLATFDEQENIEHLKSYFLQEFVQTCIGTQRESLAKMSLLFVVDTTAQSSRLLLTLDTLIKQIAKHRELLALKRSFLILNCTDEISLEKHFSGEIFHFVQRDNFSWTKQLSSLDPNATLVFYTRDCIELGYLNFHSFFRDFVFHRFVNILSPVLYGGASGVSGPSGVPLNELHARSSLHGRNVPALVTSKQIGPVWLTSGALLKTVEEIPFAGSSALSVGSVFPPAEKLLVHYDLRQAIVSYDRTLEWKADVDLERVIQEELQFDQEAIFLGSRTVIVLPERSDSTNNDPANVAAVDNLIERFQAESDVILIQDYDHGPRQYWRGIPCYRLEEFAALVAQISVDWVVATNWDTIKTANVLRYLTGGKVVYYISELEYQSFQTTGRDHFQPAFWSYRGKFVPLLSRPQLADELNNIRGENIESLILPAVENSAGLSIRAKLSEIAIRNEAQWSARHQTPRAVSLIIPVHNALDSTAMCLRSILNYASFAAEIIIVNDASDSGTSKWLTALGKEFPQISVLDIEKNVGFVQACIRGVEASSKENDIILLNSDIVLTKDALKHLQAAAYSNSDVALASAMSTNSPHLQISLNPGQSLERAAETIAQIYQPKFPTVITPEGQLLFIRRWAIDAFGFFDPVYNRGFCEESDMCMRMFLNGADMVCADTSLIFHRRSASFGAEARKQYISENRPIFDGRWGRHYQVAYASFLKVDPLLELRTRYNALAANIQEPTESFALKESHKDFSAIMKTPLERQSILRNAEVVFVLPGVILGGGSISVLQHVNELLQRGIEARILSLGPVSIGNYPLLAPVISISPEQIFELDWTTQKVIATFWTTAYVVKALTLRFPELNGYYYVQDYEPWFYSIPDDFPTVRDAEKSFELGLTCVCKTTFLRDLLLKNHRVDPQLIQPGIDHTVFYPGNQERHFGRPRIAGLYRPRTTRRGHRELIELIRSVRIRVPEAQFSLFGEELDFPEDLLPFVQLKGLLAPHQVAALYRESEIVIDLSYWQGFGRMGIEGMCCGAVPLLTNSGGVSRYAKDGKNCFLVEVGDTKTAVEKIILLLKDRKLWLAMRDIALATAKEFSEEAATDDWCQLFRLDTKIIQFPWGISPSRRALTQDNVLAPSQPRVAAGGE